MTKRARLTLLALLLFLLALIALLLTRCTKPLKPEQVGTTTVSATGTATDQPSAQIPVAETSSTPEQLTAATLQAPPTVVAGAKFNVTFTGPMNREDYITLVAPDAANADYGDYVDIRSDKPVDLTAPVSAGSYELRYVAGRSKTVLGRLPITVTAATATVTGPAEGVLGSNISVSWTGPNNKGDYVTVVPQGTPDGQYGNYQETVKGSPLTLTLPVEPGAAELRYMTGQGAKVLARSPITIKTPEVRLTGPERVVAGSVFEVTWSGPNNHADYVTIVPQGLADGKYVNYTETVRGSPMSITALIEPGPAELRYMTGTGGRVLGRRPINIVAAEISLDAPGEVKAGASIPITWTGPNNHADYITVVPKDLPDGQFADYANTTAGSPLNIRSPKQTGPAEIRYMSEQGAKVLARRSVNVVSP